MSQRLAHDDAAPRTILVVEGNPVRRRNYCEALAADGHAVIEAADGATALRCVEAATPALIVQSLRLPDVDGFALARRLRERVGEVPILACSAPLSNAELARAFHAGFDHLLVTPVEPSMLLGLVRGCLPPAPPGPSFEPAPEGGAPRARERQARIRVSLGWSCSLLTAQLDVLRGVSSELAHTARVEASLSALLHACLALSSAPRGALLLASPEGDFSVGAAHGFSAPDRAELEAFFGRAELRALVHSAAGPLPLCADSIECDGCSHVAPRLGSSALVLPLRFLGEPLGALVLVEPAGASCDELRGLAGELGVELGFGLALAQARGEPDSAAPCRRTLLDSEGSAVFVCDRRGRVLEVNRAAEQLLGRPRQQLLGRAFAELVVVDEAPHEAAAGASLASGRALRPGGAGVAVELSRAHIDVGHEQLSLAVVHVTGGSDEARGAPGEQGDAHARLHGALLRDRGNVAAVVAAYAELLLAELVPGAARRDEAQRIHAAAKRAVSLPHPLAAHPPR